MRRGRIRKRDVLIVAAGLVAIGLVVAYRDELRTLMAASQRYDRADATVESMRTMIADADPENVPEIVRGLWDSDRLAQRRFVMAYLREQGALLSPHWESYRGIVVEATTGPDADGVTDALGLLWIMKEGGALMYAPAMLRDADPRVRWDWANYVALMGGKQHASLLAPLLDDPSSTVAARAASALSKWTDQLIDVRPEDSLEVRRSRLDRFEAWWTEHEGEFPKASALASTPPPSSQVSASRSVLGGPSGESIDLGAEPNRVVLVHLFSTRSRECEPMMEAMSRLEIDLNQRVRIVHVNTDQVAEIFAYDPMHRPLVSPGVADLPVELPGGPASLGDPLTGDAAVEAVEQLAVKMRIKSPIGLDPTGQTTRVYTGLPQPTCVLIDRTGAVRRRFSGVRSREVIEAMIRQIDPLAVPNTGTPEPTPLDPLRTLPTPTLPPPGDGDALPGPPPRSIDGDDPLDRLPPPPSLDAPPTITPRPVEP